MFKFLGKRWQVVGDKGSEPSRWFRRSSADVYARDMNAYSDEWFDGEVFTVERVS